MLTLMHYKSYKNKKICTDMLTSDIFSRCYFLQMTKKQCQFFNKKLKINPKYLKLKIILLYRKIQDCSIAYPEIA